MSNGLVRKGEVMGERVNVRVIANFGDGYINFYYHSGRDSVLLLVQQCMTKHRNRWTDGPYLTRHLAEETMPSGISLMTVNNEYPIIVVDTKKQNVSFYLGTGYMKRELGEQKRCWSFEDFVNESVRFMMDVWHSASEEMWEHEP